MENNSNESTLAKIVGTTIVIGVIAFLYGCVYKLVEYLTPERLIKKSKFTLQLMTIGTIVLGFFIFDAIMEPPSHPSLAYSPQQYREMMMKKCMFQTPIFHNQDSYIYTYCVALDAPDLPVNLQGGFTEFPASPDKFLNELNIVYSTGFVKEVNFHSNNSQKFSHPQLKYLDGTTPGNSPFRFWETKRIK